MIFNDHFLDLTLLNVKFNIIFMNINNTDWFLSFQHKKYCTYKHINELYLFKGMDYQIQFNSNSNIYNLKMFSFDCTDYQLSMQLYFPFKHICPFHSPAVLCAQT